MLFEKIALHSNFFEIILLRGCSPINLLQSCRIRIQNISSGGLLLNISEYVQPFFVLVWQMRKVSWVTFTFTNFLIIKFNLTGKKAYCNKKYHYLRHFLHQPMFYDQQELPVVGLNWKTCITEETIWITWCITLLINYILVYHFFTCE